MSFPNKTGDHADTDDILRNELKAAGIQTLQEAEGHPPEFLAEILRNQSGEVKTSIIGILHGWTFKRAWYYWMAEGPGIDVHSAELLHSAHGKDVRVAGHCGSPSPREWFKGLACGLYHVDSPDGLKALADTIKGLVAQSANSREFELADLIRQAQSHMLRTPEADTVSVKLTQYLSEIRVATKPG